MLYKKCRAILFVAGKAVSMSQAKDRSHQCHAKSCCSSSFSAEYCSVCSFAGASGEASPFFSDAFRAKKLETVWTFSFSDNESSSRTLFRDRAKVGFALCMIARVGGYCWY